MGDALPRTGAPPDGWLLVLDVGSSSIRAWFYDQDGEGHHPGPETARKYQWRTTAAGAMECDATELFALTSSVIDAAMRHARLLGIRIVGVAAAALWHSLVGLDQDGTPVTPVLAWGDTRAAAVAWNLRTAYDERKMHRRTGCYLHPLYASVKLAWLREEQPDLFRAVASWVSLPEYLEWRLLGVRRCSLSIASGSGLLDVHRMTWDGEALELAGIGAEQLFPLVDIRDPVRGLSAELEARWPELRTVPWFPALGDGACANVGSGAVGLDRIGATIGTTAAVRALWEPAAPVELPAGLWCYRLDSRRWVAGSALSNGGNGVAFLRRSLRLPGDGEWEGEVEAMAPDSHGLTVLPFLVGERGANWLREGAAAMVGVTQATTPAQIMRAWMEAITYRIGAIFARLDAALGREGEVLASGGAIHASRVWPQILADVLDREVAISVEPEATSRGAALVALEAIGAIPDVRAASPRVAERFSPDPARHALYRAAMRRQEEMEVALAPWLGPERLRTLRQNPDTLHDDA